MMIQRSFEIRRAENARQKASANVELGNSRFSNASSDWYEKKMKKMSENAVSVAWRKSKALFFVQSCLTSAYRRRENDRPRTIA